MNLVIEPMHSGKKYLVTGAGSGIGKATAEFLNDQGAELALLGRSPEELSEVFNSIGGKHGRHLLLRADISDEQQMKDAMHILAERWSHLDGVVANAGINGVWAPLDDISFEEWNRTIGVNLGGTFLTIQGSLPMLRKGRGSVVVVASVNGTRIFSNSGATAYACSKAAQVA